MALTLLTSERLDLTIVRGTTFTYNFSIVDQNNAVVDLTGFGFDGEVRINVSGALLATFTGTMATPTTGDVAVSMASSETENEHVGQYTYDWRLQSGTTVYTPYYGRCDLVAGSTDI